MIKRLGPRLPDERAKRHTARVEDHHAIIFCFRFRLRRLHDIAIRSLDTPGQALVTNSHVLSRDVLVLCGAILYTVLFWNVLFSKVTFFMHIIFGSPIKIWFFNSPRNYFIFVRHVYELLLCCIRASGLWPIWFAGLLIHGSNPIEALNTCSNSRIRKRDE